MSDYTSLLSARPSFVEGLARVLDIAGTLNEYNQSPSPDEADWLATASDWYAIGDDLAQAMRAYASRPTRDMDRA